MIPCAVVAQRQYVLICVVWLLSSNRGNILYRRIIGVRLVLLEVMPSFHFK